MTAHFRYDQYVEDALRSVVRRTLEAVAEAGLPGNHHLYITFNTQHPDVDIPPFLAAQYPEEMTIVLQHQFWGLEVEARHFEVTLSFNKSHQRLHVPYVAITAFADPSVNFGLQFKAADPAAATRQGDVASPPDVAPPAAEPDSGNEDKIVTLDAFRKK
ncbi:MAG: SspB family protein [Alphaproteobacteria bacterium]